MSASTSPAEEALVLVLLRWWCCSGHVVNFVIWILPSPTARGISYQMEASNSVCSAASGNCFVWANMLQAGAWPRLLRCSIFKAIVGLHWSLTLSVLLICRCLAAGGCCGRAHAPNPLCAPQGSGPEQEGHCRRQQD